MAKIGGLRQRISIEQRSTQVVNFQTAEVWTSAATLWAEVAAIGGGEAVEGKQVRAVLNSRVKIRGREFAVTPLHRVNFNGRLLKITAAYDPDGRGRETWLDCVEWAGATNA